MWEESPSPGPLPSREREKRLPVWVPSPLAGEGQDGGYTTELFFFTPTFILPHQGQWQEVSKWLSLRGA